MQRTTASIRYAKALFKLALERNASRDVLMDLMYVFRVLKTEQQLARVLSNPTVPKQTKKRVLKKIFKKHINNITMNFIDFVISKGRELFLSDIISRYKDLHNEHNNISVIEIISAEEIETHLKDRIKEKVGSKQGGGVQIKEKLDKNLLGGIIIKRGDLQYDASVRKKLNNAKRAFKL